MPEPYCKVQCLLERADGCRSYSHLQFLSCQCKTDCSKYILLSYDLPDGKSLAYFPATLLQSHPWFFSFSPALWSALVCGPDAKLGETPVAGGIQFKNPFNNRRSFRVQGLIARTFIKISYRSKIYALSFELEFVLGVFNFF